MQIQFLACTFTYMRLHLQLVFLLLVAFGLVADHLGRSAFYTSLWADDEVRSNLGSVYIVVLPVRRAYYSSYMPPAGVLPPPRVRSAWRPVPP